MSQSGYEIPTIVSEKKERGARFQKSLVDICVFPLRVRRCQKTGTPQTHIHNPLLLWPCVLKNKASLAPGVPADTGVRKDDLALFQIQLGYRCIVEGATPGHINWGI